MSPPPTIADVAKHLHLHRRTVQRRLAAGDVEICRLLKRTPRNAGKLTAREIEDMERLIAEIEQFSGAKNSQPS